MPGSCKRSPTHLEMSVWRQERRCKTGKVSWYCFDAWRTRGKFNDVVKRSACPPIAPSISEKHVPALTDFLTHVQYELATWARLFVPCGCFGSGRFAFSSRLDLLAPLGVGQRYRTLGMNAFSRIRPLPTHRTRLVVFATNDWCRLLLAHEISRCGVNRSFETALVLVKRRCM